MKLPLSFLLGLLALASVGSAQNTPFSLIDIGALNGRPEPGAANGVQIGAGNHNTNGANLASTAITADTSDIFGIAIDNLNQAGTPTGGLDWRLRGDTTSGAEPLRFLGEDFVKNNLGIIRVTLTGLPAGTYEVTSYHTDPDNDQSANILVFVTDALGTARDTGAKGDASGSPGGAAALTQAFMESTSATFQITADGTSDVILYFDSSADLVDDEAPLNGLRLVKLPPATEPISIFTAGPETISRGESTTLSWRIAADATAATISQGVGDILDGRTDAQGLGQEVLGPEKTTTYQLAVDAPGGSEQAEVTVTVRLISDFTLSPDVGFAGATYALGWEVRPDFTSATIDDGSGPQPVDADEFGNGGMAVNPLATTTYTLVVEAADADGNPEQETAQVTAVVLQPSQHKYADPGDGWDLLFDGEADPVALLGWDHDNGSDAWDGTAPGAGLPGGAGTFSTGGDGFYRLQDTGNPQNHGVAGDPSNRKVYLTRLVSGDPLASGVTLYFKARLATAAAGGALDQYRPDADGAPQTDWDPNGDGHIIHDNGKGSFTVHDPQAGTISFSLCRGASGPAPDSPGPGDGLAMNNLNGAAASNDVDTGEAGTINLVPLSDMTAWHEFWITIVPSTAGGGTHLVEVYADGAIAPQVFDVTAGLGSEFSAAYVAMGLGSTGQSGAIDVDFFHVAAGSQPPQLLDDKIEIIAMARPTPTSFVFQWTSRANAFYQVRRSPDLLDPTWQTLSASWPSGGDVTEFLDESADGDAFFYEVREVLEIID